jgi:2-keto-4-pentenoate hydratase
MAALLARRAADLARGDSAVGWKIGFNVPALQAHFGLSGPVAGYLTDATVLDPGAPVDIGGWIRPALEVEVAVRVGPDGGVAALAPALELVDLDPGLADLEAILGGNIFHRGVLFGPEVPGADVSALEVEVSGEAGSLDRGRMVEAPATTVDVVRLFLAAHGAVLSPGDRIIAGSLIAPLAVSPGDSLHVTFGPLGTLDVRFR